MGSSQSSYGQYGDNRGGLTESIFTLGAQGSAAFTALLMLFYCLAHRYDWLPHVYSPRVRIFPDMTVPPEVPRSRRNFFTWLVNSWTVSDRDILSIYGLDALVYMRSLKVQTWAVTVSCIYGIAVLLPINSGGGLIDPDRDSQSEPLPYGIIYTIANIPADSKVFTAHIMGCYLFSLVTIWLLWKQYEEYVQLRHNYLRMAQPSQYTVMVDHIPGAMRSNFSVATFFENLFPNCIKKVTIMLEAEELDSLWAKYKKNCEWLEWAQAVTADRSQLRCRSCRSQDRLLKKIQKMLDEKEGLEASIQRTQKEFIVWHCHHERVSSRSFPTVVMKGTTLAATEDMLPVNDIDPVGDSDIDVKEPDGDEEGEVDGGKEDERAKRRRRSRSGERLSEERRSSLLRQALLSAMGVSGKRIVEDQEAEEEFDQVVRNNTGVTTPIPEEKEASSSHVRKVRAGSTTLISDTSSVLSEPASTRSTIHKLKKMTKTTLRLIAGNPVGSTAFVSFRSLAVASIAGQCMTYRQPLKMVVSPAPHPDDVIWDNICVPMRQIPVRTILGNSLAVVVTIFFSFPVGLVASLTSVDTLSKHIPFVHDLLENSALAKEFLPLLSPFLLVLLDNVIPPIFSVCARYVFREARLVSDAHKLVLTRLYTFLFYNNFLVLFLSTSITNTYFNIIDDPHKVLEQLGSLMPNISSFYIMYILVKALVGQSMELSRCSAYIIALIRTLFTDDVTPTQKANRILGCNALERPGGFYFGRTYADNLFVFTITACFSCVAPLILPVSFLFFAGSMLVHKRQILYVYEYEFESGGLFWPIVFRRMIFALYVSHVALLCILLFKAAWTKIGYVIPLPILTFILTYVIEVSYAKAGQHLPLSMAMEMDEQRNRAGDNYSFLSHTYVQPGLRPLNDPDMCPLAGISNYKLNGSPQCGATNNRGGGGYLPLRRGDRPAGSTKSRYGDIGGEDDEGQQIREPLISDRSQWSP